MFLPGQLEHQVVESLVLVVSAGVVVEETPHAHFLRVLVVRVGRGSVPEGFVLDFQVELVRVPEVWLEVVRDSLVLCESFLPSEFFFDFQNVVAKEALFLLLFLQRFFLS